MIGRLNRPAKNWKFDPSDLEARGRWDAYHQAYEAAFAATSTAEAPWYIVPADSKPAMRVIVASIIVEVLAAMAPKFPEPDAKLLQAISEARKALGA